MLIAARARRSSSALSFSDSGEHCCAAEANGAGSGNVSVIAERVSGKKQLVNARRVGTNRVL